MKIRPTNRHARRGLTLIELVIAMTLNTMLALVLAGMTLAVSAGWEHVTGLEDASQQARAGIDRITYMISQAGVYQFAGKPTVNGIAVVERVSGTYRFPEVLVIWSGGRSGGMVAAGVQTRLPQVNELVIYAPQYDAPTRLVEIVSPNDSSSIDFQAASFSATILSIIASSSSSQTLLCDRLHTSNMPVTVGSSTNAGTARFECFKSPTDAELSGIAAGSAAWYALVWSQGVVSSDTGLRQTTVRIELQVEQRSVSTVKSATNGTPVSAALPFIGSASCRYAYFP